jgi:glycosyltransferase involved in cell wall biosynthesis
LRSLLQPHQPIAPSNNGYDPTSLNIHWIIPDFGPGGGGHMTIFRMIRWLEFFGHRCTVWITDPHEGAGPSERYDEIVRHYQALKAPVHLLSAEGPKPSGADIVVATSWPTAFWAGSISDAKERFYFVQDYEPFFHPHGSYFLAATGTYAHDIACVCASPWLEQIMKEKYGRWARKFYLAADPDIYFPALAEECANTIPRIALYNRRGTPRRAVELSLLALELLSKKGLQFQVELFGDVPNLACAPFPCVDHGILDPAKLGDLYRSCDIGICFSTTNYSLVPVEMMACGLAVIELDIESVRAVFPSDVLRLCEADPYAIAAGIEHLLTDSEERRRLSHAGAKWASAFSWEKSARDVERAFFDKLKEDGYQVKARGPAARTAVPKASVVIPTLNGGAVFREVLRTIQKQRTPWPFEVVVVDSGSTDGTAEFCRTSGVQVFHEIPKSEFQHGRTRNLAISLSQGEFIALVTQDALPANEFWLYNLVMLLEKHPHAAGAFGRHMAHQGASPFTQRDIDNHFIRLGSYPLALSKYTDIARWNKGDISWQQVLHYFSDNNACLRREVWKQYPYPEIDYGEDQVWALKIIRAGYQKLYAQRAPVFHSHDYNADEVRGRAKIEAQFFRKHFGYDLAKFNYEDELRRLNSLDRCWAVRHGVSDEEIETRYLLNAARLQGLLEGSYYTYPSQTTRSKLS